MCQYLPIHKVHSFIIFMLLIGIMSIGGLSAQETPIIALDEIVFTAGVDDHTDNMEIYVMRNDSTNIRQLTDDIHFESMWGRISPDRTQIVFHRSPPNQTNELNRYFGTSVWMMNADGSALRQIREPNADGWMLQGHIEWHPSGQSLLITARENLLTPMQIYVLDLDGNVVRKIYESLGNMTDPVYSADGEWIAFVGCPETQCVSSDVYVIPADGSEDPIKLTDDDINENDPYFSPDGTIISWNRNRLVSILPPVGESLAMMGEFDGTQLTNIVQRGDNQINAVPVWSMDGERVYVHRFDYEVTQQWDIISANPDATDVINLTTALRPSNKPKMVFWFPHPGTVSDFIEWE